MKKFPSQIIKNNIEAHNTEDASAELLDLKECGLVRIPKGIFELFWLEGIALSHNEISDISPLEKLTNLQTLELKHNHIREIDGNGKLFNLQLLSLGYNEISDINGIEKLTNLQALNLIFNPLADICGIEELTNLQSLTLQSNFLSDLSFLENLSNLQSLNLMYRETICSILDSKLAELQILNLSNNDLTDNEKLTNSEKLTYLRSICQSTTPLTDISGIEKLTNLQSLNLYDNKISDISALEKLTNLHTLNLKGNPIHGVPPEIVNENNCLESLRDHFRAIAKGAVVNNEAKLILLGNGRVGKTSLVRAMLGKVFDEEVPSTDKISLRQWSVSKRFGDILGERPFIINIWDFGGQDIYYTTHKIFLRTKALFLLVWDSETEKLPDHEDGYGNIFENFKLLHWIDYIATSGMQSPVIVVQNKVDNKRQDRDASHERLLDEHYGHIVDFQYVSAKMDYKKGVQKLQKSTFEAFRNMPDIWQPIGIEWAAVRERLDKLRPKRKISYQEYEKICGEEGLEGSEPRTLINLLHNSGGLYFLQDYKEQTVILDQQWAIDAVYALFKRSNESYSIFRNNNLHGFELKDLRLLVWKDTYSEAEQKALLEFMVRTEVCFEYCTGVYIAPQLLDKNRPSRVSTRVKWNTPEGPAIKLQFRFLHHAIIERFVVRAGRMVEEKDPAIWRNGIVIHDPKRTEEALIEALPEEDAIHILTHGKNPFPFLAFILQELSSLHEKQELVLLYSVDGGRHFVERDELHDQIRCEAKKIKATNGDLLLIENLLPFVEMARREKAKKEEEKRLMTTEVPLKKKRPQPERPILNCFISYAHAHQEYYKVFLEDFRSHTSNLPCARMNIWSDDQIDLGVDWHNCIQEEIAKCDLAILLVSDRFMSSKYIKEEEVAKLFTRKAENECLVVPIYFYPCSFTDWKVLADNQLFKPAGKKYGRADQDLDNEFCYTGLLEFDSVKGVPIPVPNPNRGQYMKDFRKKLEPQLESIVAKKYGRSGFLLDSR